MAAESKAALQPARGLDVAGLFDMSDASLTAGTRIVIVAPDTLAPEPGDEQAAFEADRSRSLRIGLLQSGYNIVAVLPVDTFLPERLAQIQPDMIVVDAESQARDTLEHVVMATRDARRPIVLFTDDNDTSHVRAAIAAGVTAYVVAGLAPERVRPVLEIALARFEHEEQMRRDLADARNQLADRKLLDRAKGLMMQRHQIGEPEAYMRLRKAAMDKGLRITEVAQRIVDAADLLG
jgi:two-component system, response regulator / RNA-binding antiterminator